MLIEIFDNTEVKNLGECVFKSPIPLSFRDSSIFANFVKDSEKILFDSKIDLVKNHQDDLNKTPAFELGGPRKYLHFEPGKIACGIVTCGGLCPGINNVIRGLVNSMHYWYKCDKIYGFMYGFRGMVEGNEPEPIELNVKTVEDIHLKGGTILGSSRGSQDVKKIVDYLEKLKISILFTVGGDGTMKGANDICNEIADRSLDISIVGIPKTIDNDIVFVEHTFGYQTAFSAAVEAINSAHVEAKGTMNGIGIVKLMGRDSGYIAASASIASQDVNYVLVPESPFELEGRDGLLNLLKKRLKEKKHAVIVVAEGAGQDFFNSSEHKTDQSGNVLHNDIGMYIKDRIKEYFDDLGIEYSIKYIDPSYMIRSLPPTPIDSMFCSNFAQNAAHAGMAGKTEIMIGYWNGKFTNVPLSSVIGKRKKINIEGDFWLSVLLTTGQPRYMGNDIILKSKNKGG
ncbi:MAG: ATP-dependent 6-phosphofructokinase [Candidatus Delongbacteria bacterium]|nr:ATP-dependent 6-phosphofructokinase [Candidatus Delongbacteria bacterium]MCG2760808.1 ATP-dependent 6-phosphofructokinase [Candidatus Delongbacteria bacterium]